jgi:hypothetical protein
MLGAHIVTIFFVMKKAQREEWGPSADVVANAVNISMKGKARRSLNLPGIVFIILAAWVMVKN